MWKLIIMIAEESKLRIKIACLWVKKASLSIYEGTHNMKKRGASYGYVPTLHKS